ncbi:hypothetical protein JCM4914_74140 [Streptomyces platensis subsp. malvinus]
MGRPAGRNYPLLVLMNLANIAPRTLPAVSLTGLQSELVPQSGQCPQAEKKRLQPKAGWSHHHNYLRSPSRRPTSPLNATPAAATLAALPATWKTCTSDGKSSDSPPQPTAATASAAAVAGPRERRAATAGAAVGGTGPASQGAVAPGATA